MRRSRSRRRLVSFLLLAVGIGLLMAALVVSGVVQGLLLNQNVELRQALLAASLAFLALVTLAAGLALLLRLDRRLPGRGRRRSET